MEQKKKIKTAIIVLAILLALSLAALAGMLIRSRSASSPDATVTVPDNLITPDEEPSPAPGGETNTPTENPASPVAAKQAATIKLFNRQSEDNTPFAVGNMFPGDAETKFYCVQVSYHDKVTVHYRATVRPGYEKLAEVLKIRVNLLTTGETLYDGLMAGMPESVTHSLASPDSTTDELYYEITAYLDTSVGNEYQNKDLIADFSWWVEETGNLDPPKTGDTFQILLWVAGAAACGGLILLLIIRRRKGVQSHD